MWKKKYNLNILLINLFLLTGCNSVFVKNSPVIASQSHEANVEIAGLSNKNFNQNENDQNASGEKDQQKFYKKIQQSSINCEAYQAQHTYKNVSFACDPRLSSQIEITEFAESPLLNIEDKGDYVHPSYLSFKLKDGSAFKDKKSNYNTEINIYPIDNYREMYKISDTDIKSLNANLAYFKNILAKKPAKLEGQLLSPAVSDGYEAFNAHLNYLSFKTGQGVALVTQIQIEEEEITNQKLIWYFRGLTNNGKYFVEAIIPLSVSFLSDSRYGSGEDGYSVPVDYLNEKKKQQYKKQYEEYIVRTSKRLDELHSNQFEPNLQYLNELITSLEVK